MNETQTLGSYAPPVTAASIAANMMAVTETLNCIVIRYVIKSNMGRGEGVCLAWVLKALIPYL